MIGRSCQRWSGRWSRRWTDWQIVIKDLPSTSTGGGTKQAQGRLSSGRATSRHRRSQQRALGYQRKEVASRQWQLLSTCMKLKNSCINGKFKTTLDRYIMEQLQIRADRFRKHGRLQDKDLEEIIKGIKQNKDIKDDEGDDKAATAATNKHNKVLEAVEEGLVQVHGMAPNMKQQGIFHILGKNCNGFNNRIGGNEKIAKALNIKEDLDINCLMYCKYCINFRHKDNKNDLKQMFQCKLTCTAVSAHNIHEAKCAGRVQEEGTGTICFGDSVGYIKKMGRDDKGLGRWCWVLLGGNNGHNMQIITAYNPCKNKNVNSGTSYQQQCHYFITKKKDLTCPLILFCKHLVRQIKQW
jgi:hypothetical protein